MGLRLQALAQGRAIDRVFSYEPPRNDSENTEPTVKLRWLVPADGSGPEGGSVIARRGRMRMPLSSEPQSIRTRSEESEEGGVPPNVNVDASSKSQ